MNELREIKWHAHATVKDIFMYHDEQDLVAKAIWYRSADYFLA